MTYMYVEKVSDSFVSLTGTPSVPRSRVSSWGKMKTELCQTGTSTFIKLPRQFQAIQRIYLMKYTTDDLIPYFLSARSLRFFLSSLFLIFLSRLHFSQKLYSGINCILIYVLHF